MPRTAIEHQRALFGLLGSIRNSWHSVLAHGRSLPGLEIRSASHDSTARVAPLGQTITPIAGTKWGAYNAVTEYVDHYAEVRGSGDDASARALRAVTIGSTAQAMKAEAFRILQTL